MGQFVESPWAVQLDIAGSLVDVPSHVFEAFWLAYVHWRKGCFSLISPPLVLYFIPNTSEEGYNGFAVWQHDLASKPGIGQTWNSVDGRTFPQEALASIPPLLLKRAPLQRLASLRHRRGARGERTSHSAASLQRELSPHLPPPSLSSLRMRKISSHPYALLSDTIALPSVKMLVYIEIRARPNSPFYVGLLKFT